MSVFKKSSTKSDYPADYVREFSYQNALNTYMDWFLNRHMLYAATLIDTQNPPEKTYFYAGLVLDIPGENIYQAANHDVTSSTDDEFFTPGKPTHAGAQEQFIQRLFREHALERLTPEEVLSPYKGEALGTANSLIRKDDINEVSFIRHVKKDDGSLTYPTIKGLFINETMYKKEERKYLDAIKAAEEDKNKGFNTGIADYKIETLTTALKSLQTIIKLSEFMAKALNLKLYKF